MSDGVRDRGGCLVLGAIMTVVVFTVIFLLVYGEPNTEFVSEQGVEQQEAVCIEGGFRTKARVTGYYAEMYALCAELDIAHTLDTPSLCRNFPSKVYTGRCREHDIWNGQAEGRFIELLPEFRTACEADVSCICAAMDGDLPEWWRLDDPTAWYIYECHQVYSNGEWILIENTDD